MQAMAPEGAIQRGRLGWLLAVATWLCLALPVVLPYARAVADGMLSLVALLFLFDRAARRDWAWIRQPHIWLMFALWAWMVLCTVVTGQTKPLGQAVACVRFFVFVAALEFWVLAAETSRRRLWMVVLAFTLWIVVECWQQQLLGRTLLGTHRFHDGALTGPFFKPFAGAVYVQVMFAAFLPVCAGLLDHHRVRNWAYAVAILVFAAVTMLMIGQRMPTMLMLLGLCLTGLLFREFRLPVALALLAGVMTVALLPFISPPVWAKLVVKFTHQMETFWDTPYGWLFGRAVTMIQQHPLFGLGWDGFRDHCMDSRYLGGVSWLPIHDTANPEGCNIHPHNYWTQIGTTGGLPAIGLFLALAVLWIRRVAGGGAYQQNGRRAALLVTLCVILWPIASVTSMLTVPNAGWVFLMIGWGLAEASGDERRVAE